VSAGLALGLAGCNSSGGVGDMSQGETIGTGAGAAGGGLIGYAISGSPAGVIIGMAAGGLIGNRLSNAMDGDDQQAAAQAAARAAESTTGEAVTWRKTNAIFQTTGSGYAQAVGPLYTDASGRTCRLIKETFIKEGQQPVVDNVTLCKGPSGWVAV